MIVIRDVKPAIDENGDEPAVVAENSAKSSFMRNIVDFFDLKHVTKAIRVTFKQGDDNRRTNIILMFVVVIILLGPLSGQYNIEVLL